MASRRRDERALVRSAQGGSSAAFEELFRLHWRAPTAPRTSSSTTPRRPRTSPRSRFSPPSATSTASTGGARSARGCTGSSSTARSTTRAPAALRGETELSSPEPPPREQSAGALDAELLAAIARAPAGAPGRDRPPPPARVHAGGDRGAARPPARHGQLAAPPRSRRSRRRSMRAGARADRDPGRARGEERAWQLVRAAFAERTPAARRPGDGRSALAVAVAVAPSRPRPLSPPGRAFVDAIRERVGIENAQPALFSLPAPGKPARQLRRRRLGRASRRVEAAARAYVEASWSPLGRYVVATRANELVTLDAGRGSALDARSPGRALPALERQRHRHADRLPERRPPPCRRRRRHGRRGRRWTAPPRATSRPRGARGPGFVLAYADTTARPSRPLLLAKGGELPGAVRRRLRARVARVVERRHPAARSLDGRPGSSTPDRGTPLAAAPAPRRRRCRLPARHARPRRAPASRRGEPRHARREGAVQLRRRASRPDVVAGRPLASGRLARGGPVGVHPRRRHANRRRLERLRASSARGRSRSSKAGAARVVSLHARARRPDPRRARLDGAAGGAGPPRRCARGRGCRAPLLLRLRLVARLNERDAAPA